MSDIYLTKVERKTIFTQGLIYVLITFIVSDLTIIGPHLFSMVPWIFFLGIFGVNKFFHPIMTLTISTITAFMAAMFKYGTLNLEVFTGTITILAVNAFGIMVGFCLREFILEHRLVKQLAVRKKVLYVIFIIALTLGAILGYSLRYGNVFGYVSARNKVNAYLGNTLKATYYDVDKYQYIPGSFDSYVYRINVNNRNIELKVLDEVSVSDLSKLRDELNAELNLQSNFSSEFKTLFNYEFKTSEILPDEITVVISAKEVVDENKIQDLTYCVNRCITVRGINESKVTKCMVNIDGGVSTILKEDFDKITAEYIKSCIEVETID